MDNFFVFSEKNVLTFPACMDSLHLTEPHEIKELKLKVQIVNGLSLHFDYYDGVLPTTSTTTPTSGHSQNNANNRPN